MRRRRAGPAISTPMICRPGTVTEIASTATDAGTSAASFSADGRYVVYQGDASGGHSEIYLYDLTTGQVVFHTAESRRAASYNPVISPDGHYIIFASDARLVPAGDTNAFADIYVVDVTDPSHPVYTLVSNLANGTQPDAGVQSAARRSAPAACTSRSAAAPPIFRKAISPAPAISSSSIRPRAAARSSWKARIHRPYSTAGGVIALTGDHTGVTLSVEDPTGRFTASFNAQGNIEWHFSEPRSDFASLLPGQISTQNFVITLSTRQRLNDDSGAGERL